MIEYMTEILRCHFGRTEDVCTLEDGEMRIRITNLPRGGIFFHVPEDNKGHIKFVGDYKKTCDYLILTPRGDGGANIYFIEMKESIDSEREETARNQIICTIPILHYLISIIENPHGRKLKNSSKNYLHFVILGKQVPIRLRKSYPKVKPMKAYTIDGRTFKVICPIEDQISLQRLESPPVEV